MRPWYCAQTVPAKERLAQTNLERQGITTFLPGFLKKGPDYHIRLQFLFRGYLFFSIDDPRDWPKVTRSIGVQRVILRSPDHKPGVLPYLMPSLVASDAIDKLHSQALSYDEVRRSSKPRQPQRIIGPGCYVRIKAGTFADEPQGQRALVDWSDGQRASLLLEIFKRTVRVEFYQRDLELLDA